MVMVIIGHGRYGSWLWPRSLWAMVEMGHSHRLQSWMSDRDECFMVVTMSQRSDGQRVCEYVSLSLSTWHLFFVVVSVFHCICICISSCSCICTYMCIIQVSLYFWSYLFVYLVIFLFIAPVVHSCQNRGACFGRNYTLISMEWHLCVSSFHFVVIGCPSFVNAH